MISLMPHFSLGKQVFQGKEHYDDKSNDFGDEIIRETGYVGIPEHDKEIIKPVIRSAPGKTPSQQRPEENHRLCPHIVFQQVQERSAGYQKGAHIPSAPVMIKSCKCQDKAEYEGMSNKPSACERIWKEYPAKELIDDIWQYGSKRQIHVVNPSPDSRHKIPEDEKESKRDAEVTEKEHGRFYMLYVTKRYS